MTEEDFRAFVFENVVKMYGEVNPDFFKGTAVESEAAGGVEGGSRRESPSPQPSP